MAFQPWLIRGEERIRAHVPGLGPHRARPQAVVFSDLHVGTWQDDTGMIEHVVERTVAAVPGAVASPGDFLWRSGTCLLDLRTEAGMPVLAVMGCHDDAVGAWTGSPGPSGTVAPRSWPTGPFLCRPPA